MARGLRDVPELAAHHAVAEAVCSRDVTNLLGFGGRACATAGQILASAGATPNIRRRKWPDEAVEGYMSLRLMGGALTGAVAGRARRDSGIRFVEGRFAPEDWARGELPFFRELFALASSSTGDQQRVLFDAPTEPSERWFLYSEELSQPYS
jgi:hypothetical protein